MESQTGLPVASIGPSVPSVYGAQFRLKDFACISFSQSGRSPDIAALQNAAKEGGAEGGARTIAALNVTDSLVGKRTDMVLSVRAGPEIAVAARNPLWVCSLLLLRLSRATTKMAI